MSDTPQHLVSDSSPNFSPSLLLPPPGSWWGHRSRKISVMLKTYLGLFRLNHGPGWGARGEQWPEGYNAWLY